MGLLGSATESTSPSLQLNMVGDIPNNLDLTPLQALIVYLNKSNLSWLQSGVVNLKLVDDIEIQALNKDYSGNDYPTDVLSFSYIDNREQVLQLPQAEERELGDMVVSLETAQRQAHAAATSLAEELATLALHGILHIHGFDHLNLAEQAAMDQLQAEVLAQISVTYRRFAWESSD